MFRLFKKEKDSKRLADKALKTKNPLKAVELYSDAIICEKGKDIPDDKLLSKIYLLRGEIHLNNGVAILSSSDFLNAIELDPNNGVAHNDLGIWFSIGHFNTPNFEKALEHLDKAIECCPNRQDFKMNRAVIKIKKGDKEIGQKELEQLYADGYHDAKIAMERFIK